MLFRKWRVHNSPSFMKYSAGGWDLGGADGDRGEGNADSEYVILRLGYLQRSCVCVQNNLRHRRHLTTLMTSKSTNADQVQHSEHTNLQPCGSKCAWIRHLQLFENAALGFGNTFSKMNAKLSMQKDPGLPLPSAPGPQTKCSQWVGTPPM